VIVQKKFKVVYCIAIVISNSAKGFYAIEAKPTNFAHCRVEHINAPRNCVIANADFFVHGFPASILFSRALMSRFKTLNINHMLTILLRASYWRHFMSY